METITTWASWPWNLSTVPTRAPSGRAARRVLTCTLYGATNRMSSSVSGAGAPASSTWRWRSRSAHSSATRAASSRLDCVLPSCGTGT
ncbi:Uncharacterised protein [Bordetella pertussis]|nr:Uncharacterised protein [Bordetella pertussis]